MLRWRRRRARVAESERTGLGIGIWKERFCAIDSPSYVIPSRGVKGRNRLGLGEKL
jgi:hypothetical protein